MLSQKQNAQHRTNMKAKQTLKKKEQQTQKKFLHWSFPHLSLNLQQKYRKKGSLIKVPLNSENIFEWIIPFKAVIQKPTVGGKTKEFKVLRYRGLAQVFQIECFLDKGNYGEVFLLDHVLTKMLFVSRLLIVANYRPQILINWFSKSQSRAAQTIQAGYFLGVCPFRFASCMTLPGLQTRKLPLSKRTKCFNKLKPFISLCQTKKPTYRIYIKQALAQDFLAMKQGEFKIK